MATTCKASATGATRSRRGTTARSKPKLYERGSGASLCRLYVGDCSEILPDLTHWRGRVDLVFADPPFNWKVDYGKGSDNLSPHEYLRFTASWLRESMRMLRPGGRLVVNIPDEWAAQIVVFVTTGDMPGADAAVGHGSDFTLDNWIIWHYRFGQHNLARFIRSHMHVLSFVKSASTHDPVFNAEAVEEPSDRASKYRDKRTHGKSEGRDGMRPPLDVWFGDGFSRVQGTSRERMPKHANQLPEPYLGRVVAAYTNPGDLVLDPFTGSGTTGTVARHMRRRFIGCELSARNARSAWGRITERGAVRIDRDGRLKA